MEFAKAHKILHEMICKVQIPVIETILFRAIFKLVRDQKLYCLLRVTLHIAGALYSRVVPTNFLFMGST
jgi:hypothetical protein